MRCTHCDSQIPEGAAFCIECGAPARAATDRTIQLESPPPPPAPAQAQLPVGPAPRMAGAAQRSAQTHSCGGWAPFSRGAGARGGAIFLIGLGVLFLTGSFWPWILALVGLAGAAEELGRGRTRAAAQSLIFLGGLAVLFATGFFWPGILIVIGLAALADRM